MEESTAPITDARIERSVLYQLKAFGSNTVLNPLQLPSNIRMSMVATNGNHFLAVTLGVYTFYYNRKLKVIYFFFKKMVWCIRGAKVILDNWDMVA